MRHAPHRDRAWQLWFWLHRAVGFVLRLPQIVGLACVDLVRNLRTHVSTRRRRFSFMSGRMEVFFVGTPLTDVLTLFFGQQFWMILYDGWLIDPGAPRMARSVVRHLDALAPDAVRGVIGTHGHEEHVGNLELASARLDVGCWVHPACERIIRRAPTVPYMRKMAFGQPAPFHGPVRRLGRHLPSETTTFEVLAAPGHSDDHVVLYDPEEKLLLSGDAFVAAHFSSPNPDVDSVKWLETLRQLEELKIEVLVTGHGRIYTLRDDFPDLRGVVVRRDPQVCIAEKIRFLEWARSRVEEGVARGLSERRIEATLFPWRKPWSWRNLLADTAARSLTAGEFSRRELVRTFLRH